MSKLKNTIEGLKLAFEFVMAAFIGIATVLFIMYALMLIFAYTMQSLGFIQL